MIGQCYLNRKGLANTNTVSILDSPEMIVSLVSEGIGVSVLPQWLDFDVGDKKIYTFTFGQMVDTRTISIISRGNSQRQQKINAFRNVLHKIQILNIVA